MLVSVRVSVRVVVVLDVVDVPVTTLTVEVVDAIAVVFSPITVCKFTVVVDRTTFVVVMVPLLPEAVAVTRLVKVVGVHVALPTRAMVLVRR